MNERVRDQEWDVVIAGGGVAGLSAALTLGRARRRVLVIDSGRPRNRFADHMHGMLGGDGAEPTELLRRGREELGAYDVTIREGTVIDVEDRERSLGVTISGGETLETRSLIAASGLSDELPPVPGLPERWGRDVLHCPYCHGWEVRGQRLAVLGTSPMSSHQAELIRQWSDDLVFLTAGCGPLEPEVAARLRSRGVKLVDSPVVEVLAVGDRLTGVRLDDGSTLELDAVFTAPSSRPHDDYLEGMELARDETPMGSFISVDPAGRTSHPRIWAIGNIVNPPANVPISIGAGSMTAGMVNMALVTEEFDRAVGADEGEEATAAEGPDGTAVAEEESARQHWESQYSGSAARWSGRVNSTMAAVVSRLPGESVGEALDLGCGEGADAVWLADRGWRVTAVDISESAIERGAELAREAGVSDAIGWITADLSDWATEAEYDLVTASFFHSEVELPRTEILRRAAGRVRPGGRLVIVSHVFEGPEDIPAWSLRYHGVSDPNDPALEKVFSLLLKPAEELAALALDGVDWEVERQEICPREAVGPDGQETATVKDGLLVLRRRESR